MQVDQFIIIHWWKQFVKQSRYAEWNLIWFDTQTLSSKFEYNQINKQKKSICEYYFHLSQSFVYGLWTR